MTQRNRTQVNQKIPFLTINNFQKFLNLLLHHLILHSNPVFSQFKSLILTKVSNLMVYTFFNIQMEVNFNPICQVKDSLEPQILIVPSLETSMAFLHSSLLISIHNYLIRNFHLISNKINPKSLTKNLIRKIKNPHKPILKFLLWNR